MSERLRIFKLPTAYGLAVFIAIASISCTDTHESGRRLYQTHCANCHMDQGEGLGALIPPLAGSDYLAAHRHELPCIIRYGLSGPIQVNGQTYAEQMAGISGLSEIQITNLLNYINQAWGNQLPPYTFEDVQTLLKNCQQEKSTSQ